MRAVVLVGGEGTRLRPLTYTIPKQLLPVAEVTMIERVVAHLACHGIDEVILSMGYLPDAFEEAFPDDHCAGVRLVYAVEPERLDTAGAIRFAALAAGVDERFVVVNGDVLTDLDVGRLVTFHEASHAEATVSLIQVDDPSAFGVVVTDDTGKVSAFVEKPPRDEAPSDLVNAGTYVLEPSVLDRIPGGRMVSIERETFPAMVAAGTLYAAAHRGYWIDAGTPGKYLDANLDLLARTGPPAPGAHERDPGVWTIGAAVIEGDVTGPALIGDAVLLARGSRVERSVVGAGARVMEDAVVRRSVLLPGALVRAGAVVEESIVGEGGVIGEGASVGGHSVVGGGQEIEAGARLDGERVPT